MKATIASNLKALRERRGLTQRDVAREIDTDVMLISKWERGVHRPADATLMQLAALYEVPFAALFEGAK